MWAAHNLEVIKLEPKNSALMFLQIEEITVMLSHCFYRTSMRNEEINTVGLQCHMQFGKNLLFQKNKGQWKFVQQGLMSVKTEIWFYQTSW